MTAEIRIDFDRIEEQLAAVQATITPGAMLKGIGEAGKYWVNQNFELDGALVGGWEPLSPNTIAGRKGGSSRPLQDTGNLRQSFDYRISGNTVRIGTSVQYASFHDEGTGPYDIYPVHAKSLAFMTAGGMIFAKHVAHPGIPQRRMLPDEDDMVQIAQAVLDALVQDNLRKLTSASPRVIRKNLRGPAS